MKKIFYFLLIFIIMPILYSQKVNVSIDEFTDKKIIYTTWETLSINIASGEWYYRFYSQGGLNVLEIRFMTSNMDVRMVEAGTSMNIKFDDDSKANLYSVETQISSVGGGSVGLRGAQSLGIWLRYSNLENDLDIFENKLITLIRINYKNSKGNFYDDLKISGKNAKKFQASYKLLKDELNKK